MVRWAACSWLQQEEITFPSKRHQKTCLVVTIVFCITIVVLLNIKAADIARRTNMFMGGSTVVVSSNEPSGIVVTRGSDAEQSWTDLRNQLSNLPKDAIQSTLEISTASQPKVENSTRISSSAAENSTGKHEPTTDKPVAKNRFRQVHPDQTLFVDANLHLNMSTKQRRLKILWWNEPPWMVDWDHHVNMGQCSYDNCEVTTNRKLFNASNSVVFSVTDPGLGLIPPVTPAQRDPNQAWVFFTLESPAVLPEVNPKSHNHHWHNVFNWSWTYRKDADIFHPYGVFKSKDTPTFKNYTDIFRRKTKSVAWLVSHCWTVSSREKYVNILKRYIDVDVYGTCGKGQESINFEDEISRDYKFYLGFENALCTDYVTEKLFHYYKMDLITVVRGKTEYRNFIPQGTVLNTANFKNIKALAEYLKRLGSNEEEYVGYLRRKDQYDVYERRVMYRNALCSLCEKLNNLDRHRKFYVDIYKWMGHCHKAKDLW